MDCSVFLCSMVSILEGIVGPEATLERSPPITSYRIKVIDFEGRVFVSNPPPFIEDKRVLTELIS